MLARTVDGLLATSKGYTREILIVDDCSDVPVESVHPEVRVLRNPEPIGAGRSRRKGALRSSGDVLVFPDAHMSFADDWLDHMLRPIDHDVLLCSPFMSYGLDTTFSWGADFSWLEDRNQETGRPPGLDFLYRERRPRGSVVDVPMVIGACYAMGRAAYERLGGFSPLFGIWGCEEQDMSARAWLAGLRVQCVTRARVGHLGRDRPYPVHWDHVEYNRLVTLRTVFEKRTSELLEAFFEPIPARVRGWLDGADIAGWRAAVQARRRIGDAEFFRRHAPDVPLSFGKTVGFRRGHVPSHALREIVREEERALASRLGRSRDSSGSVNAARGVSPDPTGVAVLASPTPGAEHLDRRVWPAGLVLTCRGVRLGIRVSQQSIAERLVECMPQDWMSSATGKVDVLYSLIAAEDPNGLHVLHLGGQPVVEASDLASLYDALESSMALEVASRAGRDVFVHAGVVGWQNRALVFPGRETTGNRALVAGLVRAGAQYYSSSFAVIDCEGRVHPFATPIRLHAQQNGSPRSFSAAALGGSAGTEPLRIGLVASTRLRRGARWRSRTLSPGQALLLLFENAAVCEGRKAEAFETLRRAVRGVDALSATRDSVESASRVLLRRSLRTPAPNSR